MDTKSTEELSHFFENLSVSRIALAITIILVAAWLARYVTREAERYAQRYVRHRQWLMNSSAVARFVVYMAATGLALATLSNFNKEAMMALGAVLAFAFAFSFQDLGASLVAGITLLVDRPFQVGDRVAFKHHYGDIVEVGLRTVRLRTLDDSIVAIPNNLFLKEAVASANAGALDMMVVMHFYIDPNSKFETAKQIVYEAVVTSKYAYLAKPVVVLIEEKIVDVVFTTHLIAKAYVFNTRYEKLFASDVTERVKEAFRIHGIHSASTGMDHAPLPSEISA